VSPLRRLLLFLLLASVYFTGLFIVGTRVGYPVAFRAVANQVFGSMGGQRVARFEAWEDPHGMHDTRMSIGKRHVGFPKGLGINSMRQGYTPAALLAALVLATPVPWRRRLVALGVGLALVHVFVGLRLWFSLLWGFSVVQLGGQPLLELSGWARWLVRRADQLLAGSLYATYLVPAMIWVAVTLRPEDLRRLQSTRTCEPGTTSSLLPSSKRTQHLNPPS
jgi:hypothetical protein